MPALRRLNKTADSGPPVTIEQVYRVVDAIDVLPSRLGRVFLRLPKLASAEADCFQV